MIRVVNVQLDKCHIILKCEAGEGNYKISDLVIVDTREGPRLGRVTSKALGVNPAIFPGPIKKILRVATDDDRKKIEAKEKKVAEALKICKQKIDQLELPMKLVDARFQSNGDKITFFFIAEKRVNFRELVKQLASEFHTRIEMRQIGARNEAKMRGGVGCCGLPICCASFLPDFEPVTIRMAKDQGISLDPAKISGLCGRLLCCLAYEADTYRELNKDLPKCGSRVMTDHGEGKVVKLNVITQTLLIETEDNRLITIKANELKNKVI
ncbi:MAG: stage 0 sporulation family protein [Deltaproteobacteria bacterium]|nr:stage 0 sporulation family protein [Deltaproteobacteria bacterium]